MLNLDNCCYYPIMHLLKCDTRVGMFDWIWRCYNITPSFLVSCLLTICLIALIEMAKRRLYSFVLSWCFALSWWFRVWLYPNHPKFLRKSAKFSRNMPKFIMQANYHPTFHGRPTDRPTQSATVRLLLYAFSDQTEYFVMKDTDCT